MKLLRCLNPRCSDRPGLVGHDFAAPEPVCDRCGADGRDPKFANLLAKRELIHFDPPSGVADGVGMRHLACQPLVPAWKSRVTGEPSVVNCPACRATQSFAAADRAATVVEEDDLEKLLALAERVTREGR